MQPPLRSSRYCPIEDYALIGDCHGSALVAKDGSIDWAALQRFDADPVFCRMLDADRGGSWSIHPRGEYTSTRSYLPCTNILRTVFSTAAGQVAVTDFMPVGRKLNAGVNDYVDLNAPAWIVRRIEGLQGAVEMETVYRPSRNFARKRVQLVVDDGIVRAGREMPVLFGDVAFTIEGEGDFAAAVLSLTEGDRHDFVLAQNTVAGEIPGSRVDEFFAATRAFWEEWTSYCRYRGPFEETIRRSALTLKLLTYAPTGAIVAAPTTSLPETLGGERNWDYRFCWIRDSSFALYALAVLGYSGEADCFHKFLLRSIVRSLPEVQPMYAVDGAMKLDETMLDHLEGYMESAPVRSGNDAYLQRQIDVYGQMLDLALMYKTLGGKLDAQYRRLLAAVAKFIAAHWRDPDQGIWEMRGPARHHVHGKLMSWVGLDRAAKLLDLGWEREARQVADDIRAHAISRRSGAIYQAFDGGTDAAVLLAPMLGFDFPQATLDATIDHIRRALGRGDFLLRYLGEDGLKGDEGAFLIGLSWLIDAELALGRVDKARTLLERLLKCANDVGLYAEEINTPSLAFLGNFPQALTHLGIIGNVVNLQLVERHGAEVLKGSYADRARRAVTATFGWRGLLAALMHSRRIGRVLSSKQSKLAWP
jgi:GH15 family glucan-1,4-alpha-glucosidase